jgi:phenylacetate-CoA ligase
MYSANELGYLALQCPEHEHYHVQAEGVLLEVLGEDNRPCATGEIGRVVVTSLHNFAMPLLRYDIGDYAEAGPPCPCGRGLPVLSRIVGRTRNMLTLASGERYWPNFGLRGLTDELPILQHQIVQKAFDRIEARLVTERGLTVEEEGRLRAQLLSRLPAGFRADIVYCEAIARGEGGKFEDFVSEVGPRS